MYLLLSISLSNCLPCWLSIFLSILDQGCHTMKKSTRLHRGFLNRMEEIHLPIFSYLLLKRLNEKLNKAKNDLILVIDVLHSICLSTYLSIYHNREAIRKLRLCQSKFTDFSPIDLYLGHFKPYAKSMCGAFSSISAEKVLVKLQIFGPPDTMDLESNFLPSVIELWNFAMIIVRALFGTFRIYTIVLS